MNNRKPKSNQPQHHEPVSACDIVMEMLTQEMEPRTASANSTVGVDTSGRAIFNPSTKHKTYDEATLAFMRAESACKKNMVVSPLSKNKLVFFTTRESYPAELERAKAEQMQTPRGWMPGFRSSK